MWIVARSCTFKTHWCFQKGVYDSSCYKRLQEIVVVVIVWLLDLQLSMQSAHITTDIMSSNLDQGEVYNIM